MSVGVIITAAGVSTRFKHKTNKCLYPLQKKALILHTLSPFKVLTPEIAVITAHPDLVADFNKVLKQEKLPFNWIVIPGGETRYHSVKKAFEVMKQQVKTVFIHDGARPMISEKLLLTLKHELTTHPAIIPVIPISDTVKKIHHKKVEKTIDRSQLVRAQTPQCFDVKTLEAAYSKLPIEENATDEAYILEATGFPVRIIEGESTNIKVTTKEDILYCEFLLR